MTATFTFLHHSADMARGFELGEFWAQAEREDPSIEGEFDASLEGEVLRMAVWLSYRRVAWARLPSGRVYMHFNRENLDTLVDTKGIDL